MRTATIAGICAVLLVLAGFSISHLQSRNHELVNTIRTLRLQVKAHDAAIEMHIKALKEAEENAQARQKALEEALQAAGVWADTDLPDSVRRLLEGRTDGNSPAACISHGADGNPGQDTSKDAGRPGSAVN